LPAARQVIGLALRWSSIGEGDVSMRSFKHRMMIALAAAAGIGGVWFVATTQRTTQAAVTPAPRAVVQPVALIETAPIVPAELAEAARGKAALDSTSRTDW
jgi:hypothetical protein